MSRKNIIVTKLLTAHSLSASFQSPVTTIKYLDNCSYQVNVTTTNSTGTFSIQGSLDYAVDSTSGTVTNAGNWTDLNLSGGTPTVSAANTTILIDLNELPYVAIRLNYNAGTAGTGTCDVYIAGKQIGG